MVAGVSERTREGNDLYHEFIRSKVNMTRIIHDPDAQIEMRSGVWPD